jgi:hypothetical protein
MAASEAGVCAVRPRKRFYPTAVWFGGACTLLGAADQPVTIWRRSAMASRSRASSLG